MEIQSRTLQEHYTKLWNQAEQEFAAGNHALDTQIDSSADTRRGITLVARPNAAVKEQMQKLLQELAQLEPEQYYYPASDIHLTVLSIISCHPDFELEHIQPQRYVELIQKALEPVSKFKIAYTGLTASSSCILAQGFPLSNELEHARNNVRQTFKTSGLQQSIDQRYAIATAHSTIIRFRKPLRAPELFLQKLRKCRELEFGVSAFHTLELVYNDWYQRQSTTKILATFELS